MDGYHGAHEDYLTVIGMFKDHKFPTLKARAEDLQRDIWSCYVKSLSFSPGSASWKLLLLLNLAGLLSAITFVSDIFDYLSDLDHTL